MEKGLNISECTVIAYSVYNQCFSDVKVSFRFSKQVKNIFYKADFLCLCKKKVGGGKKRINTSLQITHLYSKAIMAKAATMVTRLTTEELHVSK